MSIAIAILGLGLLVLVHEAGHFFTALAVGMRPRKFYVGFPPALAKVNHKGVEYGLGSIPLGGYVKIPGMHRPAPSDVDAYFGRALAESPNLSAPLEHIKRPLGEGELDAAREALPALDAALADEKLSPAAAKAAARGVRELHDGLGADAYWRQRTWKRIAVILAGPAANVLLAIVVFAVLLGVYGGHETSAVAGVQKDAPAARAGLLPGDRILEINGVRVEANQIRASIAFSAGEPLQLAVRRDGRTILLKPVRPAKVDGTYRLGFILKGEGLSPPTAAWEGVKLTGVVTRDIVKTFERLADAEGREDVAGPVGIVHTSSQAVNQGFSTYAEVIAIISIDLALLNLLPLLPLDGGHIAFSVVEGLRRRSVGREVYERVSAVGIALFLLIFFLALSNDIGRLG